MVFYINKQAVEIKARFENAPLTSTNECCCVVGILAKIYGLPLPKRFDTVDEMRKDLHNQINNKPVPSEYASKIIKLLDEYYKPGDITDELYELLKYAYNEQIGSEPAYKAPNHNRI
ncbi:DUF3837 family protein [Lacrimispora indolis]|uniref:DUF3837 family protein n=1 Tax=Lacrimispora indolis TaxID=69825 RepID=UPI000462D41F|nr:DUF3837 family protein [[Clostridium] methoxybenzovorans]